MSGIRYGQKDAWRWIEENQDHLIRTCDRIWQLAELGLLEYKTADLLAAEADQYGFTVERGIAGMPTAFLATWGAKPPVIGILAELDALPGLSQRPVPYEEPLAEGAPGHACGHNIYATSALAGAIALKTAMEEHNIRGTIKLFGCPAEETLVGKIWLVRDGYFDGVDAVLAHHPGSVNTASMASSNAMNSAKLHFYGKASHAAVSPEQGISALDAAELLNVGINYMREHVIDAARIHYVMEEGGGQPNIVPPYVRGWYYVRAPERDQVEYLFDWVLRIADGADMMARTTHRVELLSACYNKLPNRTLSELVVANMRRIGAPVHTPEELEFASALEKTVPQELKLQVLRNEARPRWQEMAGSLFDERVLDPWDEGRASKGSTDVSDVSWVAPTVEFSTVACTLATSYHSWQLAAQAGMSIGHKSLLFSSKVIAATALELVGEPTVLQETKEEWRRRLGGRVYTSPVPADHQPPLHQLQTP